MNFNSDVNNTAVEGSGSATGLSRRNFLQLTGTATAAGILLASCRRTPPDTTYLGKEDTALLNYLYILETVLCNFYKQANLTPYYGMDLSEMELLADLRDHQLAHRGLLANLLQKAAIAEVVTDLSPVTFADRTNTLSHAVALEDLAVGAYYGAARRMKDTNNTIYIAKMATVQARHSAYAREIMTHNTYADGAIVDTSGRGQEIDPMTGITFLKSYLQTKLDISNLPA